jgi:hypothetical protein
MPWGNANVEPEYLEMFCNKNLGTYKILYESRTSRPSSACEVIDLAATYGVRIL